MLDSAEMVTALAQYSLHAKDATERERALSNRVESLAAELSSAREQIKAAADAGHQAEQVYINFHVPWVCQNVIELLLWTGSSSRHRVARAQFGRNDSFTTAIDAYPARARRAGMWFLQFDSFAFFVD
jgi:hypothetical protein